MKKVIAALTSITMLSSVFSGYSGGNRQISTSSGATSGSTSTPASINYYGGWTGGDLDKMSALVKKSNESQSEVQVILTSLQWSQMFAKFLVDHQTGPTPGVVATHSFKLGQLVDMGVLSSGAIKSLNPSSNDYTKTAWDGTFLSDVQYSVPLDANMHALHYNKDLFKATDIISAPTNKEELITAARKLTVSANGKSATESGFDIANIRQCGFGLLQNRHAFHQVFAPMNQQGYNPFTDNVTTLSLNSEKTSAAFQFLEDLVYKYKVTPAGKRPPTDDLKTGSVTMVIDGNWQLSGVDSAAKFGWDTATYPQVFSEKAVWSASELLTIPNNKDADKVKAAQTFIKQLPDNSAEWAPSGQIPASIKAQQAATKIKGIKAYDSELDCVKFLPAHRKSIKIFSSAALSPILTAVQNAILNDKDPAEITK